MKNIQFILTAVAMSIASLTAWAAAGDPVAIPTELGSYINWSNAALANCTLENDGTNVGSTRANTVVTFTLTNSTEQRYLLEMKTGAEKLTAVLSVTVKNGETELYTPHDINIPNTGNWSLSTQHYLDLGTLPVGTLTLEIKTKSTTGGYAGNWGALALHGAGQYDQIPSENAIDIEHGTHSGARYETEKSNIGFIKNNCSSEYGVFYVTDAYWNMKMGVRKMADGKIRVRVYDLGNAEEAETDQEFEIPASANYADQTFSIDRGISGGFKKVRLDYIAGHDNYIMNYNNLRFTKRGEYTYIKNVTIDGVSLPQTGLTALRDNNGTYTLDGNIYTTILPTVAAELNNGSAMTVTHITEGSNIVYTLSDESTITSTLTVSGWHPYIAGTNDETMQLKYTTEGKTSDDVWTNGEYTIRGSKLDGNNNSVFKFSHMGDGVHTLSVPADIMVKQVVIKNWAMNYDNPTSSYIRSVTSAGATAVYVPTHNEALHNAPYDLVINMDGHVEGTDIVISMSLPTQTIGWFELKVEHVYTRTHKHMNLNTLCYPYQIDTYSGATFYTMLHKVLDGETVTDIYLQEHVGALEAGTPYFYVPEEGSTELVCYYSGDREDTPLKVNGVQGSYDDNASVPGGAFVTYNNNLQAVTGGYVTLGEYRAYVDMNEVPEEGAVAHLQGRKMLKIRNADAPAVTTDVEEVQGNNVPCTKVIENGVLYLKYKGTKYNVQGMRVK